MHQEHCITAETINAGLYHDELEEVLSAGQCHVLCDAVLLGLSVRTLLCMGYAYQYVNIFNPKKNR